MSQRSKIKYLCKNISEDLVDIKGLLTAVSYTEDSNYPTNILTTIALEKIKSSFKNIEKCRKIMKLID